MLGEEIYKIWAPIGAKWVDWVRPVPFVAINNNFKTDKLYNFSTSKINYIDSLKNDTAIIVDMRGSTSVEEGISLAHLGYRPIPIYNGTIEQENVLATVDNKSIVSALIYGAKELENISIPKDAPPAFLLDTNRLNRYKMNVSVFDNSWDIYDQDMPTAEYLIKNGIKNILVRSNSIKKDLKEILYKYKKKGLNVFLANYDDEIKKVKITKPLNLIKK